MMMRATLIFALGLAFGACGDKDTGIDSGLPPDKQGGALTPSEQTSLCEASADYVNGRLSGSDWARFFCTQEGLGGGAEAAQDTAGQIAACKTIRDQCIAETAPEDALEDPFECSQSEAWGSCSVTVGQIETCMEDTTDLLAGLFADFTCDVLDPARAAALQDKYGDFQDDPYPPSCDVVVADCPAAFGEEEDVQSGGEPPPAG